MSKIHFLSLLLFVALATSKVTVYSPSSVVDAVGDSGEIRSVFARFGRSLAHNNKTFYGYLKYDKDNENGCKNFETKVHDAAPHMHAVFLMKAGDCAFTTMAHHAETSGASFAMIIDDKDEVVEDVVAVDDHSGQKIGIPTVLIGKNQGDKLLDALKKDENLVVNVVINVEITKSVKAELTFYGNPSHSELYGVFEKTHAWFSLFNSNEADIKIVYPTEDRSTREHLDCYEGPGKKYCMQDHHKVLVPHRKTVENNGQVTGREMILESLRQDCIRVKKPNQWLNYISAWFHNCSQIFSTTCSNDIMAMLGISYKEITSCVNSTWNTPGEVNSGNKVLDEWRDEVKSNRVRYSPSVFINNYPLVGDMSPTNLKVEVCDSFEVRTHRISAICSTSRRPDERAQQTVDADGVIRVQETRHSKQNSGVSSGWVVAIIISVLAAFVLGLFFYRRSVRVELQKSINSELNNAVGAYYNMTRVDA